MNELLIFISHSSKDKEFVKAFTALLKAAFSLRPEQIICTSLDGHRLPIGADVEEEIRNRTMSARILFGIITDASIESAYVLFELGGRWLAKKPLYPVLAGGAGSELLRGPLAKLNALSCDSAGQIQQIITDTAAELDLKSNFPESYQSHVEAVLIASAKLRRSPPPDLEPQSNHGFELNRIQRAILKMCRDLGTESFSCLFTDGIARLNGQPVGNSSGSAVQLQLEKMEMNGLIEVLDKTDVCTDFELTDDVRGHFKNSVVSGPQLSREAQHLLIEASEDKNGTILKARSSAGLVIRTNAKDFVEDRKPRSAALWEDALKQLCDNELLDERGSKGEIFRVTNAGYKMVDSLKRELPQ